MFPHALGKVQAKEGTPMGLRDRLIRKVKQVAAEFSGEHSETPIDAPEPYARPGVPNENAEVVMAKLNRPKRKKPSE